MVMIVMIMVIYDDDYYYYYYHYYPLKSCEKTLRVSVELGIKKANIMAS